MQTVRKESCSWQDLWELRISGKVSEGKDLNFRFPLCK